VHRREETDVLDEIDIDLGPFAAVVQLLGEALGIEIDALDVPARIVVLELRRLE